MSELPADSPDRLLVRRVRLLQAPPLTRTDPAIVAPAARRARTIVDRVRVRSFLLKPDSVTSRSGWSPTGEDTREEAESRTAAPRTAVPEPAEPDAFLARLKEILRPDLRAVLSREDWPAPLHDYQEHGVLFLFEREHALLADEMGLGKTVQALAAAGLLLTTGQIEQFIVLCPASLVSNWEAEAQRWLPRLAAGVAVVRGSVQDRHLLWCSRLPVLIAGYEVFRSDFQAGRVTPRKRDLVILDEAQRIKNVESDLAHACRSLPRHRSWALTGTPLENRVEDLLSILEWATGRASMGLGAGTALRELQESVQLRRTKEDVALELPPKTVSDVILELGEAQRRTYDELEQQGVLWLKEQAERVELTHVLSVLTRLKQVCNFCPRTGESVKLEHLSAQLEEIGRSGRQSLIFSQFTDDRAGVRRIADELPMPVEIYHGGMSHSARDAVIGRFQHGEVPVLALSLRAGGVGLNLQTASYVFHFDRWWNPATEWQAEDRAHRLGQQLPVNVYRYICAGTVEEKIHAVLEAKSALFRETVEGIPQPSRPGLSLDELFGVLGLKPPDRLRDREQTGEPGFDRSPGD